MAMFVGLAMAMSSVTVVGNLYCLGDINQPRSADYKPKRDGLHTDEDFKMAYSLQTATR